MRDERRLPGPSGWIFLLLAVVFLAVFLAYPVGHVLLRSVYVRTGPDGEAALSLRLFRLAFGDVFLRQAIINSFLLALATLAGTMALSLPLALVMARREFAGKRYLTGLLLVPMIMPPFVGAVGMRRVLASEGSINIILQKLHLVSEPVPFLTEGGFWMVALLQVLHLYPIMYLNVVAAVSNIDPSLEEAGRNLGDHGLGLFRRVTLPLMLPGFVAGAIIVFIWAFTDLGTPLMLNYNRVVAVQIFDIVKALHENPMGYVIVVYVVLMTTLAFVFTRFFLRRGAFTGSVRSMTGSTEGRLSRRGTVAAYGVALFVIGLALLPHTGVLLTSLADRWQGTVLPSAYTLKHYAAIFRRGDVLPSIRMSLMLSVFSTALDILFGVGIAYMLARRRFPGSVALDAVVMLPLALPGLVIAFGYVGCFSGTVLDPRDNPVVLLVVAYAIRRLPFMVRSVNAGLEQSSVELEEASMNLGASPLRTMTRVTVPLIGVNVIAGAVLCFAFAMLEVSDSLILAMKEKYYPITKTIYALSMRIGEGDATACALGVLAMGMLFVALIGAGALLGNRMGALFRA